MKNNFKEYHQKINEELKRIHLKKKPKELYDPIKYMLQMKSKRVRPILAILAYKLINQNWKEIIKSCIALELFHNFTLIHDDIMDKANLRRGNKTIHKKWNKNIGILSGDLLMIFANDLLSKVPEKLLPTILKRFNEIAKKVCEGQQYDMNYQKEDLINEKKYIEMIRLKTATLLGFSLELGGHLSNMDPHNKKKLYEIGELFGIGFQLSDDYLDVYGEKTFGKTIGGDIIENKKTYLSIKAYEIGSDKEKQQLEFWKLNSKSSDEKIKKITEIFNLLNIKKLTEKKIQQYFNNAFKKLGDIKLDSSKKEELKKYLELLLNRKI